jgi:hypothetical protein
MAYVLIEKDYDTEYPHWVNVAGEDGKTIVFAGLQELREWVSANRVYADSVRSVEVPDNY